MWRKIHCSIQNGLCNIENLHTDIPVLLQTYPDSHKMYPQRCLSKYTSFLGGNANFKPNLSLYLIGLDAGGMRFNSPL